MTPREKRIVENHLATMNITDQVYWVKNAELDIKQYQLSPAAATVLRAGVKAIATGALSKREVMAGVSK